MGCVRRFSFPSSLSSSFIEIFVFRFGNDKYRYRYRLSTSSAVIVPNLSSFDIQPHYSSRTTGTYTTFAFFFFFSDFIPVPCIRVPDATAVYYCLVPLYTPASHYIVPYLVQQ